METEPVPEENPKAEPEVQPASSGFKEDEEFYFPDGNLFVRVNTHEFFVHKYKLGEFKDIEPKLVFEPYSHQIIELEGDEHDFRNTFKVLYASLYTSKTSSFEVSILVSSLRIATKFNHSALRSFVIDELELRKLPPMDYLPFAKQFGVPEWEARALDHLAIRAEPVTVAEASLLGTEAFVAMIVRREKRLANTQPTSTNRAEDIIDLSETPEERINEPPPSRSQTMESSLSPLSPKYPRTRSQIQETPGSRASTSGTEAAHRGGVSKRGRKKRASVL
ncbi:hypothetical protein FRC09_002542 [Ceratobasidium sp. 395]|nr:hypothetical protein FRC09_002542 [Ceratobasidium sp. 395]